MLTAIAKTPSYPFSLINALLGQAGARDPALRVTEAHWRGRQDLTWVFIPFCVNSHSLWQERQGQATLFCAAGNVLGNLWGKAHPQKQTKQGQVEPKGTTI